MHICNLAAGFCAVHNNPSVAKTWTLNRLGKSIWSYYWHFLSNLNNTRKTLVKPATGWGRRHVSVMYTCGVWQTARSKLLRIHCALYAFCEDDLCTSWKVSTDKDVDNGKFWHSIFMILLVHWHPRMKWTVPQGRTEGTVRVTENNTVNVTHIYGRWKCRSSRNYCKDIVSPHSCYCAFT